MNNEIKIARIVGFLFVFTMLVGMCDAYLVAPILKMPLAEFYSNDLRMTTGALLILTMSLGVVGIAIALYPIIKRHSEMIALIYVSFRVIECVLLLVGAIAYFFLIDLSQSYIGAEGSEAAWFQALSDLTIKTRYVAYQLAMITLGVGSMLLCYLLYQSRLIPRFISVWGFVGYASLLVSAVLGILNVVDTNGAGAVFYIPGGLWELVVFPAWMIIKGFNPEAVRVTDVQNHR